MMHKITFNNQICVIILGRPLTFYAIQLGKQKIETESEVSLEQTRKGHA